MSMPDIKKRDPSEEIEARVCYRTSLKKGGSPVLESFIIGLLSLAAGKAIDLLYEEIKAEFKRLSEEEKEEEQRKERLWGSFSELRNCEFVIPYNPKCDDIAIRGAVYDAKVAFEWAKATRALADKLKIEHLTESEFAKAAAVPSPQKNHMYIGRINPYNAWVLGLRQNPPTETEKLIRPNWLDNLPYQIRWVDGKWSIIRMEGEKLTELYTAAFNEDLQAYDRDYLMIYKVPSVFEEAKGHYDFGVVGLHRGGTMGATLALDDKEFIKEIREASSLTGFFQAIASVDVNLRPVAKHKQIFEKLSRFFPKKLTWSQVSKPEILRELIEPEWFRLIRAVPIPLAKEG